MPSNFLCACALRRCQSQQSLGSPRERRFIRDPGRSTMGSIALHQQDVTPDQADEIHRLYDELLSSSKELLRQ